MTWARVASVAELPDGGGHMVEIGDNRVALFKVDETVYAIGDRCSHAEASLSEGELFDDEVECPRHGAVFDVKTGAAKSLPATTPVPIYVVRVDDGDVFLEVEES